MKNRIQIVTPRRVIAGLLSVAAFMSVGQNNLVAQPAVDPAHAAHVASGAMPPDTATGDPALTQQLLQLQTKVAQAKEWADDIRKLRKMGLNAGSIREIGRASCRETV